MTNRDEGIDLLRIISMFFVVIQHILVNGGVLESCSANSDFKGLFIWVLEIVAYCSVNCYALISGYVGYKKGRETHKWARYIELWLQVVFYGVVITALSAIVLPRSVNLSHFIKAVLPVTFNQYWFFTAYTGVFIIMPWINKFCDSTTEKYLTRVVLVISIVFSCYATLTAPIEDSFGLSNGYSFLWLSLLWLVGAWMKKCDIGSKISLRLSVVGILFGYLLTWVFRVGVGKLTLYLVGESLGESILISYVSPVYLGIAILYVCLFKKIRISNDIKKGIKFCAPASFGVYLLHMQPLIKEYFIIDKFRFFSEYNTFFIPIAVCAVALCILVFGLFTDKFREWLFECFRIRTLAETIECKLKKAVDGLLERVVL